MGSSLTIDISFLKSSPSPPSKGIFITFKDFFVPLDAFFPLHFGSKALNVRSKSLTNFKLAMQYHQLYELFCRDNMEAQIF